MTIGVEHHRHHHLLQYSVVAMNNLSHQFKCLALTPFGCFTG